MAAFTGGEHNNPDLIFHKHQQMFKTGEKFQGLEHFSGRAPGAAPGSCTPVAWWWCPKCSLHTSGMSNRADLSTAESPTPNRAVSSSRQAPGCLSYLKQTSWAVYYFSNQTGLKAACARHDYRFLLKSRHPSSLLSTFSKKEMIVSHLTEKIEAIRKECPRAPTTPSSHPTVPAQPDPPLIPDSRLARSSGCPLSGATLNNSHAVPSPAGQGPPAAGCLSALFQDAPLGTQSSVSTSSLPSLS